MLFPFFSDENMRFYLAVESFKKVPAPLEPEARRIYATFLAPDALDSVNVDAGGVARVNDALNADINNNLFEEAQVRFSFCNRDLWCRDGCLICAGMAYLSRTPKYSRLACTAFQPFFAELR